MTPLELFSLICVLFVVRLVLGLAPGIGWRKRSLVRSSNGIVVESPDSVMAIVREYLDAFIVAGLVALFLITFVVRTFYIPSGSMEPTLQIHDVLLVNEFEYRFTRPHDGDIVVFRPPIASQSDFIKRVMGVPGDQIRVQDGIVYRNNKALNEPYIMQRPAYDLEIKNFGIYVDGVRLDSESANIPPRSAWTRSDRIPANCYLMFGDNRNDSEDSHIWGFAQADGKFQAGPLRGQHAQFTGHAFLLFWPPNRLRIFH